jgi:hypothetical protein
MVDVNAASLAVWDVPMPVAAGGRFSIKVGAKASPARALAGARVEVSDDAGTVVASGAVGDTPWPGTEALHWLALEIEAPRHTGVAEFGVRCSGATTRFSVAVAENPVSKLMVTITERDSKATLGDVEIRLGPFHARTDKGGRAELLVCPGDYQLRLWRTAHIAQPQPVTISGDVSLALTMTHVPEEHPDARWVR